MTLPRCALRHQSESSSARTPTVAAWLVDDGSRSLRRCRRHPGNGARAKRVDLRHRHRCGERAHRCGAGLDPRHPVGHGHGCERTLSPHGHSPIPSARQSPSSPAASATRPRRVQVHVGDENVAIKLTQAAVSLNEVVVTGTPGSTERRALGVDVAQIDASTLVQKAPINDVQSLLNGRTPGVTLLANSGVVGAGSTVRIRGVSSFSLTNQPLIYVDGVRVDNSQSTGVQNQSFGAATTTRWNDFNPDDIESIEIVKGPAATTLYGTEAANGVIQIITKKGAIGKTAWDFSTRQGANWFSNPQGRLWTNYDTNANGDTRQHQLHAARKESRGRRAGTDLPDRISAGLQPRTGRRHAAAALPRLRWLREEQRRRVVEQRQSLHGARQPRRLPERQARHRGRRRLHRQQDESVRGSRLRRHHVDDVLRGSRQHRHADHLGFLSGLPSSYHEQYQLFQNVNRFTGSVAVNHRPVSWFNQRLVLGIDNGYEDGEELSAIHHDLSFFFDTDADSGFKNVLTRDNASVHRELRRQPDSARDVDHQLDHVARRRRHQARRQVRERIGLRLSRSRDCPRCHRRRRAYQVTERRTRSTTPSACSRRKSSRGATACSSRAACVSTTTAPSAASSATCTIRR